MLSSVGAVAGDELHTELWFWQSAMGYTDNATVQVTVAGEKRQAPRKNDSGNGMSDLQEAVQGQVVMPKRCMFCRELF